MHNCFKWKSIGDFVGQGWVTHWSRELISRSFYVLEPIFILTSTFFFSQCAVVVSASPWKTLFPFPCLLLGLFIFWSSADVLQKFWTMHTTSKPIQKRRKFILWLHNKRQIKQRKRLCPTVLKLQGSIFFFCYGNISLEKKIQEVSCLMQHAMHLVEHNMWF